MAGRHRSFREGEILEIIMQTFWRNGYAGTSLNDLTTATGLTKPSLYAAFGNKEAMFRQSLEHYIHRRRIASENRLYASGISLRDRIADYLVDSIETATASTLPGGCFMVSSICESTGETIPANARKKVAEINTTTRALITEFFSNEIDQGNLSDRLSPELLADILVTLQSGLIVTALRGMDRVALEKVIDHTLSTVFDLRG